MQQTLASLLLIAAIVAVFIGARRKARESPQARKRLLFSSMAGLAVGLVFVFWLPRQLPETPGSPGTLVGVALFWVIGSCFIFFGLPALLGAILARPRAE